VTAQLRACNLTAVHGIRPVRQTQGAQMQPLAGKRRVLADAAPPNIWIASSVTFRATLGATTLT